MGTVDMLDQDSLKQSAFMDIQQQAAAAGLGFNAVFDPIIGYFYKLLILGKPAAEITLAWNVFASVTNAVISTLVAVPLYIALRPALRQYMRRAQESISR